MNTSNFRTETDSLGPRLIPEGALYGAQTSRSLENFPFGERMPHEILEGMAELKIACARANADLGLLSARKAKAIVKACQALRRGEYPEVFALSVYQAGSGTSSHMNLNEVAAHLATQILNGRKGGGAKRKTLLRVDAHDDVNMGQSTNNVFPSGAKVALVRQGAELDAALTGLEEALGEKAKAFAGVLKAGRTHLQDAVPVTLGQEFGAWREAVRRGRERLVAAREGLRVLGVGGNAVGTGINTKPAFRGKIIEELNREFGGDFCVAEDGVWATQFMTDFAAYSGAVRCAALDLQQIANNLRLLSSGPRTGLGELRLPAVEPGSSIMPGKVNPSICEAAVMMCMQVQGLDHAVSLACGAGQLELNTHMPLIAADTLRGAQLLAAAARALAEKCVKGITADEAVCRRHLEASAALPTLLNPALGYDQVAVLVKESLETGQTLRELAVAKGLLSEKSYAALLARSTAPNL